VSKLAQRFAIAVVVVAGALGAYRFAEAPRVEVTTVARRDVVQTVVASGRIAAPFRVDIGAQVTGTVRDVPVREGQSVERGATLVVLDACEAPAAVKQAEVAVAQAEARLRQVRELQQPVALQSVRQAQANLANLKTQLERSTRLFESGFIGRSALDDARRNVEVGETQLEAARVQHATTQPAGSDYEVAWRALEQAKAGLTMARAKLAYTTITAPAAGTLIARNVERGDVVQPGKTLLVLSPAGATQIVVQVDERNLSKIRLGQSALASADAYPDDRFAATLAYINPGVDAQRGTVEVKLDVPQPPPYLRQDMTVSVDIVTDRRDAALALRAEEVRDLSGGKPWLLVVADGRAVQRPVQLGARGEGWVEIVRGVAEGEQVVPGANATVKPGQALRAVPRG
jgi:HlyD family secretion protein